MFEWRYGRPMQASALPRRNISRNSSAFESCRVISAVFGNVSFLLCQAFCQPPNKTFQIAFVSTSCKPGSHEAIRATSRLRGLITETTPVCIFTSKQMFTRAVINAPGLAPYIDFSAANMMPLCPQNVPMSCSLRHILIFIAFRLFS